MTARAPDQEVYPGLWECGGCHQITDHTHFYRDRADGTMRHAYDPMRETLANQCGWRWNDDYESYNHRCELPHGHHGVHRRGGTYPVKWTEEPWNGAIRPANENTENGVGGEGSDVQ